jgi:hypothetical protein
VTQSSAPDALAGQLTGIEEQPCTVVSETQFPCAQLGMDERLTVGVGSARFSTSKDRGLGYDI